MTELMSQRNAAAVVAALVLTASLTAGAGAGTAFAGPVNSPKSGGYDGVCKGGDALTGTTIVIDAQDLSTSKPLVRCSPQNASKTPRTGMQALEDAGIKVEGVDQWGLGFVCRINDLPGPNQVVPIKVNPSYKESCEQTPPGDAYWSYWIADGSGNTWSYSNGGVLNRTVVPGGFEGWSFSHAATATTNPQPRVAPHNPAITAGRPVVSLMHTDLDGVIKLGESVTFNWTATNTDSVSFAATPKDNGWPSPSPTAKVGTGTVTVKPTATGTFTYTITGKTGKSQSMSASATLTVKK